MNFTTCLSNPEGSPYGCQLTGSPWTFIVRGTFGGRLPASWARTGAAANAAGVSPQLAAKFDERLDPWYYRYGRVFWHDSAYPMTGIGDEAMFVNDALE